MGKNSVIKWRQEPEDEDYPAAASYLTLLYNKFEVKSLVKKLKYSKINQFKAKDIFRASGLSFLGVSNSHVEKDQNKINDGEELSPILLVRDENNKKVIIADGYHRMCAVYSFNEDTYIPCKIV
jgi:disulfide oxidoreductase YuzD